MFLIAEILKKYNEETEKYTKKEDEIRGQIKRAEQRKITIREECYENKYKLLQKALAIIEQASEDPAVKTFARKSIQFRSLLGMETVVRRLNNIGVKNIKVGGLLGRFGAEYIEDEVFKVEMMSGHTNILRISCNHQTGVIYKIETFIE